MESRRIDWQFWRSGMIAGLLSPFHLSDLPLALPVCALAFVLRSLVIIRKDAITLTPES
jgi:hypothetical protein